MLEVTQKIEHLLEQAIDTFTATKTDDGTPLDVYRTWTDEQDCNSGIRILTRDVGMLPEHEGTCCNVRQVFLAVGLYTPKDVDTLDRDISFSKFARELRLYIHQNLKTILNTWIDGVTNDFEMTLFHHENTEIGEEVDIDIEEDFTWISSGAWFLVVNGEPNDFD